MVEQWSDAFGGIETKGLLKGPAYQIFESNGTLVANPVRAESGFLEYGSG